MEKFKESVESTANYEGNDSLLLFERVKDPVIYEQILDLLCKGEESLRGVMCAVTRNAKLAKDEMGNVIEIPYIPKTKEEIKLGLDEAIAQAESSTEFEKRQNPYQTSSADSMAIGALVPWTGKPYTEKQMSIVEAHEKGHNIRYYDAPFHAEHFRNALRLDPSLITDTELALFKKILEGKEVQESDETIRDMYIHYMSSPIEISERMSQLKNYFGMDGSQEFTREHLEYARAHYVKDTDMNNGMELFFHAITPDTEEEFLRIINSSGI